MESSALQNNLYWQLFRVAINAKHGLMDIAEKHKLTVMQMYTLCLLEADKSIPMNSLSTTLHCDASNITGIVDKLFQQKYIKREENPHDRRSKMITLTPKGVKLCLKIAESLVTNQPTTLNELSKQEREQLLSLLSKTTLSASLLSSQTHTK
jgi:DNA-binding MarR family transcriptional regulator